MLADNQTHNLPRSKSELAHFANFMGHAELADLFEALTQVQNSIAIHAEHKILLAQLIMQQAMKHPTRYYDSLLAWLTENGFSRPHDVADTLSGWMAGRIAPPEASVHGCC